MPKVNRSELNHRMKFAEKYPTEEQVSDVIREFRTWFRVTHEALTDKVREVLDDNPAEDAAEEGDDEGESEARTGKSPLWLIEQWRQEAAGEVTRAQASGATWPRPHRLRTEVQLDRRSKPAPAGPHVNEGRLVLPGEEVLLTEQQWAAWADKFEPVTSYAGLRKTATGVASSQKRVGRPRTFINGRFATRGERREQREQRARGVGRALSGLRGPPVQLSAERTCSRFQPLTCD